MITVVQAIILGLFQGVTELFPVSSLGHSIILPAVLDWHIDQSAQFFVDFLVATHFATAIILFWIYRKDWMTILEEFWVSLSQRRVSDKDPQAKLAWLIIAATIPAGLVGVLFQTKLEALFASPISAAIFLILNGCLLFAAERSMRGRSMRPEPNLYSADAAIAKIGWGKAIKIGCMQILALIPGFSRTGSAVAGGVWSGLSREDAVRFSFLLAAPLIGAAALLKLPSLLMKGTHAELEIALIGAVAAAITSYFSATFIARYVKTKTLKPFATYCVIAGLLVLIILH